MRPSSPQSTNRNRGSALPVALPAKCRQQIMPNELPDETHTKIQQLCAQGDDLARRLLYEGAVEKYQEALNLLSEPVAQWEAATWIFTAIGDARFLRNNYKDALQPLLDAMKCPKAIGNPFVHLRLGQIQFELGNDILAKDEFARAYMGGGKEIFDTEDPKYWAVVTSSLKQPPDGW
jgi:hypothetical protein